MNLNSSLPISHTAFAHWHTDDTEVGIIVAKAAFLMSADGTLPQVPPPALDMADAFAGDPATSALITEQDIAPLKPKTDLIIRGSARSPQAEPRTDWPVTIEIPDVLHYSFHVRGPATWFKPMLRWKLSAPDPVTVVPLTYDLAYGGRCGTDDAVVHFEQNPAGRGFMTDSALVTVESFAAPQIGLLADFMAATPTHAMTVCGTMPLAKAWLPRRSFAGTFDAAWERDRHPRMPLNYDLTFWNAAHPRLQVTPHLTGDEVIRLSGMSHDHATVDVGLPGARLAVRSTSEPSADLIPMNLDTIDLDVEKIDTGQITLTLLWRAKVSDREAYAAAEIIRG